MNQANSMRNLDSNNNNDGVRDQPPHQNQYKQTYHHQNTNQQSDKRRHNPQHSQQQQQQQQNQHFHGQRDRSGHRDRSGQRNQGQHPDSSMNRADSLNQVSMSNLGWVRFTPGMPTKDLPPIETKLDPNKKFSGRCRLFVGNLPHNTSEEKVKRLFERFGEVGEVFLGPKSSFAFVKMDTRQNAEAARDALDCTVFESRSLRVRLAAHAAAIRVKHLSSQVTNELLAYAFRYFGEVERAVVVVDDKGKSTGEGVIEYAKKQSAQYAIKKCQSECFMLTSSLQPVLVEPYDQHDEDEGLPEKSINRNSNEFKEQRETGPRFAEQGTFEHNFGVRWKDLYEIEKQKRDRLEQEIQDARKNLQDQIDYSRLEHDTMQLRNRLQQLEDDRIKLQQLKEQTMNDAQKRGEHWRNQDMMIRQREDGILHQQANEANGFNQPENAIQMQASRLQEFLNTQVVLPTSSSADSKPKQQPSVSHNPGIDTNVPMGPISMASQIPNSSSAYSEPQMVGLGQPQFIPIHGSMNLPPPPQNAPNMFTAFMPQSNQMQIPMPDETQINQDIMSNPPIMQGYRDTSQGRGGHQGRQNKMTRQFNPSSNNVNLAGRNGRPRKRGKF